MAAYATQADMISRFGPDQLVELTDRADPPAGAIDTTALDLALNDAESEINSYIVGRYTLPLANPPQVLNRMACDMARYYLAADRTDEVIVQRYQDAVKFLQAVSQGKASLGVDDAQAATPTPPSNGPAIQSGTIVFSLRNSASPIQDYLSQ